MRNLRIFVISVLCVMAAYALSATVLAVGTRGEYTLCVTPEGQQDIVLEVGQPYEDGGATGAVYVEEQEPQPLDVQTHGAVDSQRVGTYMIRYTVDYQGDVGTAYRRVKVVDSQAPVITLVADPNHYTLPNETYQEEGYSATDNYDGDLTDKVLRVDTGEAVIYSVADSCGNRASVTRTIVYNDPTPPELTLQGEDLVIISAGDDYREPGYTAADNCDGDITDRVSVSGGVNTYVPGRYVLTYTVKDSFENTDSAERVVFVKEREVEKVNDTSNPQKVIYLTFDDGPGPETPRLLDVLKKYNVQATFFAVNTAYISTVQRAAAEGHTIAIHTTTHQFHDIYASEDAFFADLYGMQSIIQEYTGQTPMLMRFPGGSSNTISSFNEGIMTRLTAMVGEKGFTYFDWNVDSNDAGGARTPDAVYNNVVEGIGDKEASVVLMHDIKSFTVDAIEKIIVWGLDNGYTFLPLTADSPTCHHTVNN